MGLPPTTREECCMREHSDSSRCFPGVHSQHECCGQGYAMLFADSPREPLKAQGDHPAFSAQQVSWESWIHASSQVLEFKLGAMSLVFRDFKISRFGMESQLKELQKDAYGFSTLLLHSGDVVLDVGANVGVVSIWLAKLYPGIRIIAIELDPTNFRFMLWNLHHNNVTDQVWPVNVGACESGNATYELFPPVQGGVVRRVVRSNVPCMSLQSIFQEFGIRDLALMKLDCEGCEFSFITSQTAEGPLRLTRTIVGEFHDPTLVRFDALSMERAQRAYQIMCAPGNTVLGCQKPAWPYQ
ncbi:sdnD [Symbiodinium sp. CCMP2456]|nr:sdnD [Symbiodinium sp. CCMP2456]